jgi:tRNA threonylcarbamoyl adenosine modification protein YjeE
VPPEQHLPTVAATEALGRWLAVQARAGDILLLDGPLGAGKTTLVRAFVAGLGGDPRVVASPTFTLLHHYAAQLPIAHVDAYRLEHPGQLVALGFDEIVDEGIGIIEWAERVAPAIDPARAWRVVLAHTGSGRTARIEAPAGRDTPALPP